MAVFTAHAQAPLVSIDTVYVGDLGNAAKVYPSRTVGSVSYGYQIGKYEVTIAQYAAFLNAVATNNSSAYLVSLWSSFMATDLTSAGIARSGSGAGGSPFVYSIIGDANRPIAYVSALNAARFCNWLHHGATNGASTETGAYTLNGATNIAQMVKESGATWWLPSEDEWYKSAYYIGGSTNAGYWIYPTRSHVVPGNLVGTAFNNANGISTNSLYSLTQSTNFSLTQNYLAAVGSYSGSPGPYGTFDQAGNLAEWSIPSRTNKAIYAGGDWDSILSTDSRNEDFVYNDYRDRIYYVGFRVATRASSNAVLVSLAASDGTFSPPYNSEVTNCVLNVGNEIENVKLIPAVSDSNAVITIRGVAVRSGSESRLISLFVGTNFVDVGLNAPDGSRVRNYSVAIVRAPGPKDLALTNLAVSAGTLSPLFNKNINTYTVTVDYIYSSISLKPFFSETSATVRVNSSTVESGKDCPFIELAPETNIISIIVTGADGIAQKTYLLSVTRVPENKAKLQNLEVSVGGPLLFLGSSTNYSITISSLVENMDITAVTEGYFATLTINGVPAVSGNPTTVALPPGPSTNYIVVTAQDGITTKTYQIRMARSPANLSDLVLSSGRLVPSLNYSTTNYTASVSNSVSSIIVTPRAAPTSAPIRVNGQSVLSGSPSDPIALGVGANVISVSVLGQGGITDSVYKVTVTRAGVACESPVDPDSLLVAGWDFQTTANGGTAVATQATPTVYMANFGSGTLYFNGEMGSSNWFVPSVGTNGVELVGTVGSTVNLGEGFSVDTATPAALRIYSFTTNNGKAAVFSFSMAGLQDLSLKYSARFLGTSSYKTHTWSWSVDGTNFTPLGTISTGTVFGMIGSQFTNGCVLGFSGISALDQATTAYLRVSFSGASGSGGSHLIDNFQLRAKPFGVPAQWFGDGTNAGGSGSWSTAGNTWSGDGGATIRPLGPGEKAIFDTTGGTVTVAPGGVAATAGIDFEADNYFITGDTLTLGAAVNFVRVNSNFSATVNNTIAGTNGLIKNGSGTLKLAATNTISGAILVPSGAIEFNHDAALGDSANDLIISGALKVTNSMVLGAGRDLSGDTTFNIAPGSTLTVQGAASHSSVTLANRGTLALQGATRNLGAINLDAPASISATGAVGLKSINAENLTNGTATIYPDIVFPAGGANKVVDIAAGGTIEIKGSQSNGETTGFLQKIGAGTLVLSGSNYMGGVWVGDAGVSPIEGGTVVLRHAVTGTKPQGLELQYGAIHAATNLVFTNGIRIAGREYKVAEFRGATMEFKGTSTLYRANGTSGDMRMNVFNTLIFSGPLAVDLSGGGTATVFKIGGTGTVVFAGTASPLLPIKLVDGVTLVVDGTCNADIEIGEGCALKGQGVINGSLDFKINSKIELNPVNALTVDSSVSSIRFDSFRVNDVLIAPGLTLNTPYPLFAGSAMTLSDGVTNMGLANAESVAYGRKAFFSIENFQLAITLVSGGEYSLQTWRKDNYGIYSAVGNAADLAAPDGDGIENIIKYALCMTPGQNSRDQLPSGGVFDVAGGRRLAIQFTRDPSRLSADMVVEVQSGLDDNWIEIARSTAGESLAGSAMITETQNNQGTVDCVVRDTVESSVLNKRFMRVRIIPR